MQPYAVVFFVVVLVFATSGCLAPPARHVVASYLIPNGSGGVVSVVEKVNMTDHRVAGSATWRVDSAAELAIGGTINSSYSWAYGSPIEVAFVHDGIAERLFGDRIDVSGTEGGHHLRVRAGAGEQPVAYGPEFVGSNSVENSTIWFQQRVNGTSGWIVAVWADQPAGTTITLLVPEQATLSLVGIGAGAFHRQDDFTGGPVLATPIAGFYKDLRLTFDKPTFGRYVMLHQVGESATLRFDMAHGPHVLHGGDPRGNPEILSRQEGAFGSISTTITYSQTGQQAAGDVAILSGEVPAELFAKGDTWS